MSASIGVVLLGAGGRMGSFAAGCIEAAPGLELVAKAGSAEGLDAGCAAAGQGAQVALDLTRAGLGQVHGAALLEAGLRIVIGTSGVDEAQTAALDGLARGLGLGGCVVPNFSVGAWLQQRLAAEAARYLPSASIVELHHPAKLDAPSGTAVQTAEALAAVTGSAPAIQSVRVEGLHARQDVLLGGPGELLTLSHQVSGREAYGAGLLASLRYAAQASGVTRGLDDVLAWEARQTAHSDLEPEWRNR